MAVSANVTHSLLQPSRNIPSWPHMKTKWKTSFAWLHQLTMQLPDEVQESAVKTVPLPREMPMGHNSTQSNMSVMWQKTHQKHPTAIQRQIWKTFQWHPKIGRQRNRILLFCSTLCRTLWQKTKSQGNKRNDKIWGDLAGQSNKHDENLQQTWMPTLHAWMHRNQSRRCAKIQWKQSMQTWRSMVHADMTPISTGTRTKNRQHWWAKVKESTWQTAGSQMRKKKLPMHFWNLVSKPPWVAQHANPAASRVVTRFQQHKNNQSLFAVSVWCGFLLCV